MQLFCTELNTSGLFDAAGGDLSKCTDRVKFAKLVRERNMLTVEYESPINEGDVSREEKQNFDGCPGRGPDEGDFVWESQKVVVDLVWPSVAINVRIDI
jgi:hypothetical protein